jgi:hypothetical protein
LRVLDLFAGKEGEDGLHGWSRAFAQRGHEVVTVDIVPAFRPTILADIMKLEPKDIGKVDVALISPPCEHFSVAAISRNWVYHPETDSLTPRRKEAEMACNLVKQSLYLALECGAKLWWLENPRAALRKMPFMRELPTTKTPLKRTTVSYCLAGETMVVTRQGNRSISSLAGGIHTLLTSGGKWVEAPVRNYGKSQLYRIRLSRSRMLKSIYATADHLWFFASSSPGYRGLRGVAKTVDLRPGRLLPVVYPERILTSLDRESVARGFVFGDGYNLPAVPKLRKERGYAQFCGSKDEPMLPFFEGWGGKRMESVSKSGCRLVRIQPLPPYWKTTPPSVYDLPQIIEGWLSGYFAADGSVAKSGQVTMCSAESRNIETFQALCSAVGIHTREPVTWQHQAFGKLATLHALTLARSSLSPEFFHLPHHRERFEARRHLAHEPNQWSVISVEPTERFEDVYCAEVPGTASFVIEGNILTHNCRYGETMMKPSDIWGVWGS